MKKAEICLQNDFFEDVVNNPKKYDFNLLIEVAFMSFAYRKRILDYMFRELLITSYNDIMMFKTELQNFNMYDEYVESIINGNDDFLKTSLVLYYENALKDELFESNLEVATAIVNSKEKYEFKLTNLINISQFKCNDEEILYIKHNISNIIHENVSGDENTIKTIEKENFEIIDSNQEVLNNTFRYINKR